MTGLPPPIDPRDRQDIVDQTTALVTRHSDWRPRLNGQPDAGTALIAVFARFAELLVARLNQVPERNYLAFLNLIGTRPKPPLPARVPLTFSLAERSPADAVVPAGTQVAATALPGEEEEVVFETGADLVVTRAQLRAVFVGDAENDRHADRTAAATGLRDEPFDAFTGDQPVPHELYIAHDELLTREGNKDVTFVVSTADGAVLDSLPLSWSYWDGTEWRPVSASVARHAGAWHVTLSGLPPLPPREVNGISAGWVRARLDLPLPHGHTGSLPSVGHIAVRLDTPAEPVAPPAAFVNTSPLDVSRPFYPFGEQPRFTDTFYLACPDDLVPLGVPLRLGVTLANATDGPVPPVNTAGNPELVWEAWDGAGWRAVAVASEDNEDYVFAGDASVVITPPPAGFARTEVNGTEHHWLRIRLVNGDYGAPAGYRYTGGVYEPTDATLAPPVVATLAWTPVLAPTTPPPASACVSHNDFRFATHTTDFTPFTPSEEPDPALYLGFDEPFGNRPVTLYLQVEPPAPEEVTLDWLAGADLAGQPDLVWEYSVTTGGTAGWRPLAVVDGTGALAARDVVRFVGPPDLAAAEHFGQKLCWLRLRHQGGTFPIPPRLRRVLPNTTWTTQAVTVTGETLGSGTGEADQSFATAQTPVLAGQLLEVREPAEEAAPVAADDPEEIWVRWHEVPDFHGSGPLDRHYVVDPRTGAIGFGDGQSGRVPPRGRNNIRVTYRAGGGTIGNRATGTIVTLKSALPFVDAVTNHEPSQGGAGWEPLDRVRDRGPKALRHRDRAVTAEDLSDLAFESSTEVARVQVVSPSEFDPFTLWLNPANPQPKPEHWAAAAGVVGVIVVPDTPVPRPVPGLGLLRQVEAYLRARCGATTMLWVVGPEWISVTVTATVVPSSPEVAGLVRDRTTAALDRYLHPLTGGPGGTGWAFGRKPHRSDLFAVAEAVDGVDHVTDLTVAVVPESEELGERLTAVLGSSLAEAMTQPVASDLARWLRRALVYSGQHQITVTLEG